MELAAFPGKYTDLLPVFQRVHAASLYSIFFKDSQNVTKEGVIFDCDLHNGSIP